MTLEMIIFDILTIIGCLAGLISGIYLICVGRSYVGNSINKVNFIVLGVVDILMGALFVLAAFHVDGFANMSTFSKFTRPLILLILTLPAFIARGMQPS